VCLPRSTKGSSDVSSLFNTSMEVYQRSCRTVCKIPSELKNSAFLLVYKILLIKNLSEIPHTCVFTRFKRRP
jgi:hypothetical protein